MAAMFQQLLLVYPEANENDYRVRGQWNEEKLRSDTDLLRAHIGPAHPLSVYCSEFGENCRRAGLCYACLSPGHKMTEAACKATDLRKHLARCSVRLDKEREDKTSWDRLAVLMQFLHTEQFARIRRQEAEERDEKRARDFDDLIDMIESANKKLR